ncbi:MAG: terpene cyclase/mutase family protein [Planctomycetota bacterium]|nr:terpene cyclase/mutase family protein [Planctomycetota bacterium]
MSEGSRSSKVREMLSGKKAAPKSQPPPLPSLRQVPDVELEDELLDVIITDDEPPPPRPNTKPRRKSKPSGGSPGEPVAKTTDQSTGGRKVASKDASAKARRRVGADGKPIRRKQPASRGGLVIAGGSAAIAEIGGETHIADEVRALGSFMRVVMNTLLFKDVKRGMSGAGVSVAFHILLIVILAIWTRKSLRFGDDNSLTFSWLTTVDNVTTNAPQDPNVVFKNIKNTFKPIKEDVDPNEKPAVTKSDTAKEKAPSKLADVGGLLSGRSSERKATLQAANPGAKQADSTIRLALTWLRKIQKSDGSWSLHDGYENAAPLRYKTDTGATALALMAFLGDGHFPGNRKSPHASVVESGLKWLVRTQKDGNFFDIRQFGREPTYYAHSMATIAMCEAYGLSGDDRWRQAAERGVYFLVKSQHPFRGGWKYMPQTAETKGDLSVTAWALMALHTARAVGIDVDSKVFDLAALFLDDVQEMDGARYKYEFDQPAEKFTPSMTAAGLLCRQYLGWQRATPQLQDGIDYLLADENKPEWSPNRRNVYEWYYVAQALHNMEGHDGERFKAWFDPVKDAIISHQSRGSWDPAAIRGDSMERAEDGGRLYMTVMCVLILETPYRHKPILARE